MDAEGELDEIAELIGLKARLFGEDLDMDIALEFSSDGKDSASDAACSGGRDGFFKEDPEVASLPAGVFEISGELKLGGCIKESASGIVCATHQLPKGLGAWLRGRFLQGGLGDIDIERKKRNAMIHAKGIDADGVGTEEMLFCDVHREGFGAVDRCCVGGMVEMGCCVCFDEVMGRLLGSQAKKQKQTRGFRMNRKSRFERKTKTFLAG
jgi:hypothetical protein